MNALNRLARVRLLAFLHLNEYLHEDRARLVSLQMQMNDSRNGTRGAFWIARTRND